MDATVSPAPPRPRAPARRWLLIVGGLAPSVALAGEHPLRTEGSAALKRMRSGLSAEEAVARVVTYTGVEVGEDGSEVRQAGAALPEVEVGERAGRGAAEDTEPPSLTSEELDRVLAGSGEDERILVSLSVPPDEVSDLFATRWAVANLESYGGEAPSVLDVRAEVAESQRAAFARPLEELQALVEAHGGEVMDVAHQSGGIEAELAVGEVRKLLGEADLVGADVVHDPVADSYSWSSPDWSMGETLTGQELEEIIQSRIFYRHPAGPYFGDGEFLGTTEPNADELYVDHPGFKDASGNDRVSNCDWSASTNSCSSAFPNPGAPHPTAVASVMVGDITLGQDSYITDEDEQRERSGVARGAGLEGKDNFWRGTVETWATSAFQGSLINESGHTTEDCTGNTDRARMVNAAYEAGVGWFNSMGNEYHPSPPACNAAAEASALGAFAVSAITWDGDATSSAIAEDNSRGGVGGSNADGRGRAIVGIAAPTRVAYPYNNSDSGVDCDDHPMLYGVDWEDTDPCGPEALGHTSGATPVVTGAAALFRQFFLDNFNTSIEDPGVLYTNLLLMGDRTTETGTSDAFGNLWGAGRLRLRAFDSYGLDNPAGWKTGSVCVGDATTVTLPAIASPGGGQTLGAAADRLRVVAWWYDRRVDDGLATHDHDNVELRVYRHTAWNVTQFASSTSDNRQRITVSSGVGGSSFSIKLIGTDVTADDEGCGTDSMRVYWAWMFEDTARDDSDTDLDGETVMTYTRVDP